MTETNLSRLRGPGAGPGVWLRGQGRPEVIDKLLKEIEAGREFSDWWPSPLFAQVSAPLAKTIELLGFKVGGDQDWSRSLVESLRLPLPDQTSILTDFQARYLNTVGMVTADPLGPLVLNLSVLLHRDGHLGSFWHEQINSHSFSNLPPMQRRYNGAILDIASWTVDGDYLQSLAIGMEIDKVGGPRRLPLRIAKLLPLAIGKKRAIPC